MPVQPQYLAYVLEQLSGLSALRSNRMFGGIGLYSDGLFFGLIDDDTLFFKTDESNAEDYRARRMPRFMPFPDRPEAVLGYHQVPADVIEDAESLVNWARRAIAVALRRQAAKAAKPARQKVKTAKKTKQATKALVRKKPVKRANRLDAGRLTARKK